MLLCVLTLCQRKHRLSHYLLVETRGTLFQLIIVSESLPIASKSCIIVANMDDKFFLQTSLGAYDTVYEPPLVLRAYYPIL
jgi:hypothetical protein